MKWTWLGFVILLGFLFGSLLAYIFFGWRPQANLLPISLESKPAEVEQPLNQLAIQYLRQQSVTPAPLQLGQELERSPDWVAHQFTFQTDGRVMSGRITVPESVYTQNLTSGVPVIVMLRGYVPASNYINGAGTNPAARYFASQGFVTVAPDFLGYAQSDTEYADNWEGRFRKPLQIAELIKGIKQSGLPISPDQNLTVTDQQLGLWAHSNGGQIALTALEILGEPIPTTLWNPVTAPFPYSILFFGDEEEDEGLAQRRWINLFDRDYQASDFSFTQHLDLLASLPIQIHQGLQDEAIHFAWNDEFVEKLEVENQRRQEAVVKLSQTPTPSLPATISGDLSTDPSTQPTAVDFDETNLSPISNLSLDPIDVTYFRYPGTDHNMRPSWETVVNRDWEFFRKYLKQTQ